MAAQLYRSCRRKVEEKKYKIEFDNENMSENLYKRIKLPFFIGSGRILIGYNLKSRDEAIYNNFTVEIFINSLFSGIIYSGFRTLGFERRHIDMGYAENDMNSVLTPYASKLNTVEIRISSSIPCSGTITTRYVYEYYLPPTTRGFLSTISDIFEEKSYYPSIKIRNWRRKLIDIIPARTKVAESSKSFYNLADAQIRRS